MISVSGTKITVKGASGATLNGDGSRWWDGEGSNGGKTKPKFFYAHKMSSSAISDIHIVNSPVQVFSINGATDLTLSDITIDNSDGDTQGGHNTDAFDVGSSTGITITGATVYNQDDCLAINSGTVRPQSLWVSKCTLTSSTRTSRLPAVFARVDMACPLALWVDAVTTMSPML